MRTPKEYRITYGKFGDWAYRAYCYVMAKDLKDAYYQAESIKLDFQIVLVIAETRKCNCGFCDSCVTKG